MSLLSSEPEELNRVSHPTANLHESPKEEASLRIRHDFQNSTGAGAQKPHHSITASLHYHDTVLSTASPFEIPKKRAIFSLFVKT
jgi:hypothetical protein